MAIEGVDFSDARPSGASLVAAGKHFVIRYVPYGGYSKGLTATEIADYRAHGLDICLIWEQVAGRILQGRAAGITDATTSINAAKILGFPNNQPIYFAADVNVTTAQFPVVDDYLAGAASVIGLARVGIYGHNRLIDHCFAAKSASWLWQTYAWSGTPTIISSHAHILQYHNGVIVGGGDVDLCRAFTANYGQWSTGIPPAPDTGVSTVKSFALLPGPIGTIVVKGGPGYGYYDFATDTLIPMTVAGMGTKRAIPIQITGTLPGGAGGVNPTGWLVGSGAAFVLAGDAVFTPDALAVADCSKEIAAAITLDRGKAKIVYS